MTEVIAWGAVAKNRAVELYNQGMTDTKKVAAQLRQEGYVVNIKSLPQVLRHHREKLGIQAAAVDIGENKSLKAEVALLWRVIHILSGRSVDNKEG
jgi:hypothetical protein